MPKLPPMIAAFALILSYAGPAFAHAHLRAASPAADATLRTPPTEVVVTFTETLEEKLSSLVVRNAAGKQVDKGDTHSPDTANRKTIAVSVGELPAGTYTVHWTATSVDTHKTTGSYSFTLKP